MRLINLLFILVLLIYFYQYISIDEALDYVGEGLKVFKLILRSEKMSRKSIK